jgi:hypothetical protein
MSTNAFTAPRRPFFTDAELGQLRKAAGGQRGGQTRHRQDNGQVYTASKIKPAERAK